MVPARVFGRPGEPSDALHPTGDPVGPEARYLHDADALDWLGAVGVARLMAQVDENGGKPTGPDIIKGIENNMKNVPPAFLDAQTQAKTSMDASVKSVQDVDAAWKALGITRSGELTKTATDTKAAYDTILTDATASINDIQRAWIAMTLAQDIGYLF